MKRLMVIMLAIVMLLPLCACGKKSEAAALLDEMILQLGEISIGSGDDIRGLEEAVDRLDSADRRRLDNLKILEQARDRYDALCAGQVELQILAIGNVTLDSEDAIKSARSAYNTLDDSAKALVSVLQTLTDAEQALDALKVKSVENAIDGIGVVDYNSGDSIVAARDAYEALEVELQPMVSNKQVLDNALINYKQAIIDHARGVYDEMDCSESLETISDGLAVLTEDETLNAYMALFEAAAPKLISQLTVLKADNARIDSGNTWTVKDGAKYTDCYVFSASTRKLGIVQLNLDGKYEKFSAVFFPCLAGLDEDDTARLIVYGDGEQVLFDSHEIDRSAEVGMISLNVEGVRVLKIEVTSSNEGWLGGMPYETMCIADAFFWNTLTDSDFDAIH